MTDGTEDYNGPLLILRLMDLIRKEYNDRSFTIAEVTRELNIHYACNIGQVRLRLERLFNAGYIEGEKVGADDNNWIYWLPDSGEEEINQATVMQNFLLEFMNLFFAFINKMPLEVLAVKSMIGYNHELMDFLKVSKENEFPMLDDDLLNKVILLSENFKEKRFTFIKDEHSTYQLFVFQVRVLSKGIYIAGIEPQSSGGAKLHWLDLSDLFEIKKGDEFRMSSDQMDFIKENLSSLPSHEIKQLSLSV